MSGIINYSDCICLDEFLERNRTTRKSVDNNKNFLRIKNDKFNPWQRLYDNYTNSFMMKTISRKIPRYQGDELDFVLSTVYQQNEDLFADKCEIFYQPVTLDPRKLILPPPKEKLDMRHDLVPEKVKQKFATHKENYLDKLLAVRNKKMHKQLFEDHPLIIGGISNKIHASSIKLMNSSHHSPQTNAGYVRQDRDGNVFQY